MFGLILTLFIFNSCATTPPPGTALTPEERAKAQKQCIANYTATGAATGALTGALTGLLASGGRRQTDGALVGGAVGAVTGGTLAFLAAYGHCMALFSDLKSYPVAGARETAQKIGYTPSQGYRVKIENFFLNPDGISPGGRFELNGTYYIMAPEGTREVKVMESRTLYFLNPEDRQWKELGTTTNEITSGLGTRRTDGHVDLPKEAPEGNYQFSLKILALQKEDKVIRPFKIQKGLAMGPIKPPPSQPQPVQAALEQPPRTEKVSTQVSTPEQPGSKKIETSETSFSRPPPKKIISVEITSKSLNVRQEASNTSRIVAVVKQGEIYELITDPAKIKGAWVKIKLDDGTEGWVFGTYIKIKE